MPAAAPSKVESEADKPAPKAAKTEAKPAAKAPGKPASKAAARPRPRRSRPPSAGPMISIATRNGSSGPLRFPTQ